MDMNKDGEKMKLTARIFFSAGFYFVRYIIYGIKISGTKNIERCKSPLVFVSNHEGAFGPVSLLSTLPVRAYPWVTHEIMSRRECAAYLQKDFTEAALKLSPRLNAIVSKIICYACVAIMQALRAIPVYRNSRKILGTLQYSLNMLEQGKNILIFPEIPGTAKNTQLGDLYTGFLHLARMYYSRHSQPLTFVPIAVNKKARRVSIGSPVIYNPDNPFWLEKERLKQEISGEIQDMFSSMEEARISG